MGKRRRRGVGRCVGRGRGRAGTSSQHEQRALSRGPASAPTAPPAARGEEARAELRRVAGTAAAAAAAAAAAVEEAAAAGCGARAREGAAGVRLPWASRICSLSTTSAHAGRRVLPRGCARVQSGA